MHGLWKTCMQGISNSARLQLAMESKQIGQEPRSGLARSSLQPSFARSGSHEIANWDALDLVQLPHNKESTPHHHLHIWHHVDDFIF
ncbi:hypothetical protein CRG98_024799 [Punica granatum]|uniref:Uncharacterized protein n=1 Tax=Punica granatum TaxID=22663 RepID=A0A2I0JEV0_PUNGR|nr:hypothetical protein CRG98_024799 [Punica granatum]